MGTIKSIEQKAKAYDEALKKAKDLHDNHALGTPFIYQTCEKIFPELKENEDERIRKMLIEQMKRWLGCALRNNVVQDIKDSEDAIDWLEKQGEQPNKVSIWKHWKDGIAGNGEDKLVYLVKSGNTYMLSSCLGFECDYIELSELDKLCVEKQGEQKPAWSEEDEETLDYIIDYIENNKSNDKIYTKKTEILEGMIDWLKSLKERMKIDKKF